MTVVVEINRATPIANDTRPSPDPSVPTFHLNDIRGGTDYDEHKRVTYIDIGWTTHQYIYSNSDSSGTSTCMPISVPLVLPPRVYHPSRLGAEKAKHTPHLFLRGALREVVLAAVGHNHAEGHASFTVFRQWALPRCPVVRLDKNGTQCVTVTDARGNVHKRRVLGFGWRTFFGESSWYVFLEDAVDEHVRHRPAKVPVLGGVGVVGFGNKGDVGVGWVQTL